MAYAAAAVTLGASHTWTVSGCAPRAAPITAPAGGADPGTVTVDAARALPGPASAAPAAATTQLTALATATRLIRLIDFPFGRRQATASLPGEGA